MSMKLSVHVFVCLSKDSEKRPLFSGAVKVKDFKRKGDGGRGRKRDEDGATVIKTVKECM